MRISSTAGRGALSGGRRAPAAEADIFGSARTYSTVETGVESLLRSSAAEVLASTFDPAASAFCDSSCAADVGFGSIAEGTSAGLAATLRCGTGIGFTGVGATMLR